MLINYSLLCLRSMLIHGGSPGELGGLLEPTQRITNLKEDIERMRQEGVWGNHLELFILV